MNSTKRKKTVWTSYQGIKIQGQNKNARSNHVIVRISGGLRHYTITLDKNQREYAQNFKINRVLYKEVSWKCESSQMKVSNISLIRTLYLEWLLGLD